MPDPTQAQQIEAAGPINHEEARDWALRFYETSNIARCYLVLTAAAQVGKQEDDAALIFPPKKRTVIRPNVNATIERCAQVAEEFARFDRNLVKTIVAAIRKLKDET